MLLKQHPATKMHTAGLMVRISRAWEGVCQLYMLPHALLCLVARSWIAQVMRKLLMISMRASGLACAC